MDTVLNGSVLLQIGISALVIVVLYGLHCLVEGFEKEDRERLMRQRYARRWADQEWMAALKNLSDRHYRSPFTIGRDQDDTLPGMDVMQGSPANQAREIYTRMLGISEYSIVGEPVLNQIPVGIQLMEEMKR